MLSYKCNPQYQKRKKNGKKGRREQQEKRKEEREGREEKWGRAGGRGTKYKQLKGRDKSEVRGKEAYHVKSFPVSFSSWF